MTVVTREAMASVRVDRTDAPLAEVRDLRVSFAGRQVVKGVSFSVSAGQCLAIVGESGSGKSVTARTLIGLTGSGAEIDATALAFGGRDLRGLVDREWRAIRGREIGFVLQDALVSLDQLRTVGSEIAESLTAHGSIGRRTPARLGRALREERVVELLDLVGVPEPRVRARQRPHELSGGLRQRALIASALAQDPKLLIADEPTTALDATVQAQILDVLAEAKSRGNGIILISHDLAVVSRLADRVAVMRDGEIVEYGNAREVLTAPQHAYTRGLIDAIPSRASKGTSLVSGEQLATSVTPTPDQPLALRVRDLHKSFGNPAIRGKAITARPAVAGVSFDLAPGRTLGIVGESGSGKTTTARIILGLTEPDSGTVELNGAAWSGLSEARRRASRHLISVIYQDPLSSFDPRWTVDRILADALRVTGVRSADLDHRITELLDQVGLPTEYRYRHPSRLSGGQRQRVAIARALAPRPAVIVCDEPVSALDVSIQARILDLLARLQAETGVALVFISHDLGVIHHVSDDIAVMRAGEVVEYGSADAVFDDPQHPYTRELLAAVPRIAPAP
ncbi:dipeptide ABC transporter ATP-binding protein [Gordonia terrae]